MSRTSRIHILSRPLHTDLTRAQALLACDVGSLYRAAAAIAAGAMPTRDQVQAFNAVHEALGGTAPIGPGPAMAREDRALLAASVAMLADTAAVRQRSMLASTVAHTLQAEGWTVTVIDAGGPDRYAGIEATRGTEQLVAAAGPGELIADQAGLHECGATVEVLASGLQEIGCAVAITDDVSQDGDGALFALPGGPTRAHAVQASLRRDPGWPAGAGYPAPPSGSRLTA